MTFINLTALYDHIWLCTKICTSLTVCEGTGMSSMCLMSYEMCVSLRVAAQSACIMSYVRCCCHLPECCVGVWRPDGGLAWWRTLTSHTSTHTHTTNTYGQSHSDVLLLLRQITWLHGNPLVDLHDEVRIDLPSIIWRHNTRFVMPFTMHSILKSVVVSHTHHYCSTTQHALLLVSINCLH